MHFGIGEMIVLAIALALIFSASRMGALGNALGKFVHAFRKASKGDDFIDLPAQTTSPPEFPEEPPASPAAAQNTAPPQKHS